MGNVLCEASHVVWLECEEFCSKTVDWPQINTQGGRLTLNSGKKFVSGEGGEARGGRERRGGGVCQH